MSINNNYLQSQVSAKTKNNINTIIDELKDSLYLAIYNITNDIATETAEENNKFKSYEDIVKIAYSIPSEELEEQLQLIKHFLYKKAVEIERTLKV